jgi:tRNA (cmo5U34)-methyltransferase
MSRDRIYENQTGSEGTFEFSAEVADVFPDMLRRSIPGYEASLRAISALARRYVQPDSRCKEIVAADKSDISVDVVAGDIRDTNVVDASMVVMNYTLQFLPIGERARLIRKIAAGMRPGGIFVLSEKVVDEDAGIEDLLVELHHNFKRRHQYSELEISRKRAAIENVLLPETIAAHKERIRAAGFQHVGVWLRYFNFVSIVALKAG